MSRNCDAALLLPPEEPLPAVRHSLKPCPLGRFFELAHEVFVVGGVGGWFEEGR
jgi:hypothetical protein